jgi:phage host-nuclease inhibitor protein Gam
MSEPVEVVEFDEEAPGWKERWKIQGLDTLDWALRRLAEARRFIAENDAVAAANIARIEKATEKLNAASAHDVAFFSGVIEQYVRDNRRTLIGIGSKKSRSFPHGTVSFRKTGGRPVIGDKEALMQWAMAQPVEANVVRLKMELAWDQIKSMVEEKAIRPPPGVDIEPETETFKIEAIGDAAND